MLTPPENKAVTPEPCRHRRIVVKDTEAGVYECQDCGRKLNEDEIALTTYIHEEAGTDA